MKFYLTIFSVFAVWFTIVMIIISDQIHIDLFINQEEVISNSITQDNGLITYEDTSWKINYENNKISTYEGKIRHISKNSERYVPILTHDIVVTTGDYENEYNVKISVDNHRLAYRYCSEMEGTINLIHAIPEDINVYYKLIQIKYGDRVRIEGYEISKITNLNNKFSWKDDGCNTLHITNVEFIDISQTKDD